MVLAPPEGAPFNVPVARELAEVRVWDGEVRAPDTAVPKNVPDGKILPAVAVGNGAVESTAPVLRLRLGTGRNVKQHMGEHRAWDSDKMKRYVVVSLLVLISTCRLPLPS